MPSHPSELESMPVRYEVDDLVALSNLVGRSPVQIARLSAGAISILILCALVGQVWALTGFVDWPSLVVIGIAALAFLICSNRRFRASMWLKVSARNPLSGPHSYAISTSALKIQSPASSSEVRWTAFIDARQAGDRLFLFMNRRQAFIIPSRAFRDEQEFEAFAKAALEHWKRGFGV